MANINPRVKDKSTTVRFTAEFKEMLRTLARCDNRSVTSYIEQAVREKRDRRPDYGAFSEQHKETTNAD